jgi:simple sugar transport system substrate-binding protein
MRRAILVIPVVVSALVAGCASPAATGSPTAAPSTAAPSIAAPTAPATQTQAARTLKIGFLTFMGDAFFAGVSQGAQQEATTLGQSGKYTIQLLVNNTNNDAAQEAQLMSTFVTQKVDAIVLSPLSQTGSLAAVKAAAAAGIPVICYNTCLADADVKTYVKGFVETDQTSLGTQTGQYAAKWIQQHLGGNANIGILNCDVFEACKERKAGFKAALAGLPGVKYVADQEGYTSDKSAGVAQTVLTGNPSINVLWSANQLGFEGEIAAVKTLGLAGKVYLFGTDISTGIANAILNTDNVVQCSTGQSPLKMGATALDDAVAAATGQALPALPQITPNGFFSRDDPAAVQQYLTAGN